MDTWELLARERVRDTYAAYSHAGDRFRLDELADCFADDGVLQIKGGAAATGPAEIVELLSGARSEESTRGPQVRHFVANLAFTEVMPDRVRASAYFQVLTQRGLDHWGRYRDVLVPVGERWLFKHRLVAVDAAVDGAWYDGPLSRR